MDRCCTCAVRCKSCKDCEGGELFKPLGASVCVHPVVERFENCLDLIPDSYVKSKISLSKRNITSL